MARPLTVTVTTAGTVTTSGRGDFAGNPRVQGVTLPLTVTVTVKKNATSGKDVAQPATASRTRSGMSKFA
jgi:hypothetical protein